MTQGQFNATETASRRQATNSALRVVFVYAMFAGLWILLSDKAVAWIFRDPEQMTLVSMLKGWLFVGVTALLLYGLIRRLLFQVLSASRRELEAQSEKLRATRLLEVIAGSSTDMIFAKDLAGRYLLVNKETAKLFGMPAAKVIGSSDSEFFPEQAAMLGVNDRRVIAEKQTRTFEETLSIANGKFTFLATKGPLYDENNCVIGMFGIARDITERKRIEAELRESERRLMRVIDGSAQGFWDWNLQSNRFTVSARFETMLGYEAGEMNLAPENWDKYVHPDDLIAAHASIQHHLAGAAPAHEVELRLLTKSGDWLWVLTRGRVVERSSDGAALIMSGTHTDITERKQLEFAVNAYSQHLEELVVNRTRELEVAREIAVTATQAKSAFLANMSHEIRTPLNAITGMVHLVKQAGIAPEQAERLDKINMAGEHLLEIINAVLDLSKIEAGKLLLEEVPLNVERLLGSIVAMEQGKAQAKGLTLKSEVITVPQCLLGDPTRLKQALLNYVSNAIKFTEAGEVILRAEMLEEDSSSALLRFTVVDTGIGIAQEILPKLFTAFEQADNSTTRKYGGSGLGLAITKKFAQLMGGDAGAESCSGSGSAFWITVRLEKAVALRASHETEVPENAEEVLKRNFSGCRVLLAEDEPINREIAQMMLSDAGLVVDFAEDGVQAVDMASINHYDLILMDMQMPKMNGLDATREIRKLSLGASIPILAMTANAFAEDRARCFESGMNDFIAKPVRPEDLFSVILKWLLQSRR